MDRSLAAASWAALQAHLHDPTVPWTLCHGDFHASNMIWRLGPADGASVIGCPVRMYDWSEVGPWEPTTDLAQMAISDVPIAVLAEHARPLVRRYWQRLLEASAATPHRAGAVDGPQPVTEADYPFERCFDAFARGGIERWIWLFAVLSNMPGLPDSAVQYFHDQLHGFVKHFGDGRPYYTLKAVVVMDR